jgi:alpha-ketoglutarate-dependent taurine dioxygenase
MRSDLNDVEYTGRHVWTAAAFDNHEAWRFDVDASSFALKARAIREELRNGAGFVILRGLMLGEFTASSSHLGSMISQTLGGDLLYSVRDEGIRLETDYGKPGVRTSKTNAGFQFHTDSPSRLAGHTPEFIALYVIQTARSGGESALANGYAVHNIIREERPDLLARLYQPFWVDRRAELPAGEDAVAPVPVFSRMGDAKLLVRYLRLYIVKGQELRGAPLDAADIEALDFFDSVMNRPGVAVIVPMERGDIQIVNNTFLLHSRTAFEDHPEPELKRHYIRIWLNDIPEQCDFRDRVE